MEAPDLGSNNGILNRISNLEQAAAGTGKLFVISEDRLRILASLAKQVFRMCEEIYKVESKPSKTTAHVHWPPTQEITENVHKGHVEASAAVSDSSSHEEIDLPTSHHEPLLGDEVQEQQLCTIQSVHSIPVHEETTQNTPMPNIKNKDGEGDILLDPDSSGDMNDVASTQPEMMESATAMNIEDDVSSEGENISFNNIAHTTTQSEMMESGSAMNAEDDIPSEGSEWQMLQIKTEHDSDIDPDNDADINNDEHIQPELMESPSAIKDKDKCVQGSEWQITDVRTVQNTDTDPGCSNVGISNAAHPQVQVMESASAMKVKEMSDEGSEWQMTKVKTEQGSDTGYYIVTGLTCVDFNSSDEEDVLTNRRAAVVTNNDQELCENQRSDKAIIQQNKAIEGKAFARTKSRGCQKCGKMHCKNDNSCRYMKTNTGETPGKCPESDVTVSSPEDVCRQEKTDNEKRPQDCDECGQQCRKPCHLHEPGIVNTGENPEDHHQYGRGCRNKNRQRSFTTTRHPDNQLSNNQECGKTFTRQPNLDKHRRLNIAERPYHCQECGVTFNRQGQLFKHMTMTMHTGKRPFQCPNCRKTFSRRHTLDCHRRLHSGERPYKCLQCGKAFTVKSALIQHMRSHTGEKPYQCEQCGRAFSVKSNLRKHLITHTGEKPFACQECDKTYTQQASLLRHLRTHSTRKPYECQECGMAFTENSALIQHMRSHTGEKPYQCEQCGRAFSVKYSLVLHKRIHSGIKPYKCKECDKTFTDRSTLTKHLITHTGEKPFACQECDKAYTQQASLVRHLKTHTGQKP